MVIGARFAKIGANKILTIVFEAANRLVDIDKFYRDILSGLIVLQGKHTILTLGLGLDIAIDRRHDFPAAFLGQDARPQESATKVSAGAASLTNRPPLYGCLLDTGFKDRELAVPRIPCWSNWSYNRF